jgi:uncharacterized membrane protein
MQKWLTTTLTALSIILIVTSLKFYSAASAVSQRTVNQTIEEARAKLNQTFNATVTAERAGANVNEVVEQLNHALNYTVQAETALSRGDSEQAAFLAESAIQLCNGILSQTEDLRAQAETMKLVGLITPIVAVIALVFVGGLIFFIGRRFWVRRREERFLEMRVKKSSREAIQSSKGIDAEKSANEERIVIVAVLAALIVVSGLLVYVSLTPPIPETFAAVYILNSEGKAENLPEVLMLGRNNSFSLRVGVENFMGRVEHGIIYVKVANGTVLRETLPEETVMNFERILANQETWEFPVALTLDEKGVYRVSFELWLYDETESVFVYSKVTSGLWLEVVAET